MAPLLDRLGARLGLDAIGRIEARESHIPERASVLVPIEEQRSSKKGKVIPGRGRKSASPEPMNTGLWNMGSGLAAVRRPGMTVKNFPGDLATAPVRLFAPPEPVEAWWVVPDDPPFRFIWRRRDHLVARADGAERIAEEWWVAGASGGADAMRDYYRIEDAEGRRFWLFRAGLADAKEPPRWFLHGVFA